MKSSSSNPTFIYHEKITFFKVITILQDMTDIYFPLDACVPIIFPSVQTRTKRQLKLTQDDVDKKQKPACSARPVT